MAVDFIAAIHVYRGLTADAKPLGDVPVGSTFTEKDGEFRTWIKSPEGFGEEWSLESAFEISGTYEEQSLKQGREIIKQLKKLNED